MTRRPQRSLLSERNLQKTETTVGHMRSDIRENAELHTGDMHHDRHMVSGHNHKNTAPEAEVQYHSDESLQQNIGESLKEIDKDSVQIKDYTRKKKNRKKIVKLLSLVIGLAVVVAGAFLVYKAWNIGSRVFNGDMLGIFQQQALKTDQQGRSNVLIVGTTDDDPDHPGGDLTDSMMVVSIDQKKKDAYMFSIPRDLYVEYGQACASGYSGKINAYMSCAANGTDEEAKKRGLEGLRQFVGDIFGMDIQYGAHINTMVIKDSVDAVGGVMVNVDSRDPRGVLDGSLDWMCRETHLSAAEKQQRCPTGHYIDFKNGPNEMDGDKAMWFSRARGLAPPTYGLEESNFDREKNQQLVLMALKEKATSTGTLTDLGKVMGLMDAMGNNLRTNIDPKEVQTVMKLGSEIDIESVHQLSFYEEENRLMTIGDIGGQSIVQPVDGLYSYASIRSYLKKNIYANEITREAAKVVVLNGGSVSGVAQKEADKLAETGMVIAGVDNAPEGDYSRYEIYSLVDSTKKEASRKKLAELYGVKVSSDALPFNLDLEADFVIVIGPEPTDGGIIGTNG